MKKILIALVAILWIGVVAYGMTWWFKKQDKPEVVESTELSDEEKQEFFVETSSYNKLKDDASIIKIGKINSSQDIELKANAAGRVWFISVKPGQKVYVWQTLATLEDNIWNYGINISKASNGIERSKINYDSNKINLDKAIFDAELNVSKLERNLENFIKDSEQNLLQAEDNLSNSQYGNLDSSSSLRLQQLDSNIAKARLDYEIKLTTDAETINTYRATLIKEYNGLLILLDDVIEFSDRLLGVTYQNRNENDDFDQFLWVRDTAQKTRSEQRLTGLINYRNGSVFQNIDADIGSWNISEERMIEILDWFSDGYEQTKVLLNSIETTLNNSIQSVWSLGQAEISSFVWTINWYQSQLQASYSWFISFESTVKSFLRTYRNNQASILKSIELQEQDRDIQFKNLSSSELSAETWLERTKLSIEENIKNLEDQIKTAKNNLDNAIKTRSVTLRSLNNSIAEAQINYTSSAKEYSKLTITSPINGTISEVIVDEWEEVFSGGSLFKIVSDSTPEIELSFSAPERDLIDVGQKVYVDLGAERLTGSIYSISDVADENLNYKSTIIFTGDKKLIWNLVNVEVPIQTSQMLIPINILKTQWDDIALVKTLSGSTFSDVRVRMWEVFWKYVEIKSCAKNCEDLRIITNDVSNFDENKFIIVEK